MPDFRKNIEDANYKPVYENQNTTGPGASGDQTTWANRKQLTQSSAQELADLLGATLTQVSYTGGPFGQDKPQWQLDFSPEKGDELDASLVYDQYKRSPAHFNQQREDELKQLRGPLPPGVEVGEGADRPTTPPIGGGGVSTGTIPGPGNWPAPAPPNVPGPDWTNVPPVPPATGIPPVQLHPGTGVAIPGGYTTPPMPPSTMPPPSLLNNPQQKAAINYNPRNDESGNRSMYPQGLLAPAMNFPEIKPQQTGLLGMQVIGPDGKPRPMTPEEIMALTNPKYRPPEFSGKNPPYTDVT